MASGSVPEATSITIGEGIHTDNKGKAPEDCEGIHTDIKGKAPEATSVAPPKNTTSSRRVAPFAAMKAMMGTGKGRCKRGLAVLDFFLRLCAIATAITSTVTMGTTDETLPFVTPSFQFYANFSDLPALTFFVIGNAIAGGYLILSLPFSIVTIVRPHFTGPRLLLLIFDIFMVALTTAAGSSAAAIVYLAHTGNTKANWVPICQQFDGFCQQISGAVVVSFVGTSFFMMLVLLAALAMRKY